MRPRIAIPIANSDLKYAEKVMPQYKRSVEESGGEAVEIPIASSPTEIAQLMKSCAAVLLPGSPADVDPQKYGAAARDPHTSPMDVARDDADELLIQDAHNMRKPILGICYGMQSLNVWRTGTLKQHLQTCVHHTRPEGAPPSMYVMHPVVVEAGTRLAHIVAPTIHQAHGSPKINVNSSHHQAVALPGDGLLICAVCPEDGTIEAVEGTSSDHFVIGVQWHPERSFDDDEYSKAVFRAFVEAARQWHEKAASSGDFEAVGR
ncbi:MAG TPA: gamma-glutamyl-gamma-aminobutyrate hydrolase family protein [Terriglobales bacterium]|nr:gamma-glutamyl-gamma-aminobutyrate hydrolase family protein [Terriglobales bacterium]